MASTPVIAKFDIKYGGSEQWVAPNAYNVPIDLVGRLDIDVAPKQEGDGSLSYTAVTTAAQDKEDTSTGGDSTVVFLLITTDPLPAPDQDLKQGVSFSVTGSAASGEGEVEGAGEGEGESADQYQKSSPKPSIQQKATSGGSSGTSAATGSRWFPVEFPIVLLGNGAVKMLDPNPTTFRCRNNSKVQVKFSVRVGRRLNQ